MDRFLPAAALSVLQATGLGLWYLLLEFVTPADLGNMNGKRKKWPGRQGHSVDTEGPGTWGWPAILLSVVGSALCRPLQEQTRLVQEQRGQAPTGCGKGAYP